MQLLQRHACAFPRRQKAANQAYANRLQLTYPAEYDGGKKFATGLGQLPDFRKIHTDWEHTMAVAKARNRGRLTVPKEFKLNGKTTEEQVGWN